MSPRFTDEQIAHMQGLLKSGLITDYYAFQRNYGRRYADFAPNVSGNSTFDGRMAVNMLKQGVGEETAQEIHGELAQALAEADLNSIRKKGGSFPTQKEIEDYHAEVFKNNNSKYIDRKDFKIPLETFGGALPSKHGKIPPIFGFGWGDYVADMPSEEIGDETSKTFDDIDSVDAVKKFGKAAVDTFNDKVKIDLRKGLMPKNLHKTVELKDWTKGGTVTASGAVVNEGDILGTTLFVDKPFEETLTLRQQQNQQAMKEEEDRKDLAKRLYNGGTIGD